MELNLYRMHLRDGKCLAKHPERSTSYQQQENRRGWKTCACPIQASGTLGGKFARKSTGKTTWEEAKAWAKIREDNNSWDGPPPEPPSRPAPPRETQPVPTTKGAVEQFLAPYEKRGARSTRRSYACALNRLTEYAQRVGIRSVAQWKLADVRSLRDSWEDEAATVKKYMTHIRTFFRFCIESEWIGTNPGQIRSLRTHAAQGTEEGTEKYPFTDAEVERMLELCNRYKTAASDYRVKWKGEDLADFILVSVHTGLRISDMCKFHISRLDEQDRCKVRATKNRKWVMHKLPSWLAERIRWRAEKHGPHIFGQTASLDPNVYTGPWRRRLIELWNMAEGGWERTPTPHRFRHTFARILLQTEGVEVKDVADLLGDTVDMVYKNYGTWVNERQERLDRVMTRAFRDSKPPKHLRLHRVA